MTERVISYLLLLGAAIAVLMVVIVQPHNTAVYKKHMQEARAPLGADVCMMGGMTCDQYQTMLCAGQGGTWNSTTQTCTPPQTTCNGQACSQMTCEAAGYTWDVMGETCLIGNQNNNGGTGDALAIGGVSTNERLAQRIESQCLSHVERSGYGDTVKKYGWFADVRTYANNACTYAYLATNGKFGSNNDLYLVANLLTNDYAVREEDMGLLYQALENAPAQKKGQTLSDYLDPTKDGVAKYLKAVMDIMATFNDTTTDQKVKPAYLTEPLPYVTQKDAAAYNAAHGTKIISVEEKFLALLPKPEEVLTPQPEEPVTPIIVPEPKHPEAIIKKVEPTEEAPSISQRVAIVLNKIVNKLKGIREEGLEKGIAHTAITPSLGALQKDFEYQQAIIKAFDEAHDNLCAKIGC